MLDGYIIEKLQKIEQDRAQQERERARLPIPTSPELPPSQRQEEPEQERGVVVIEFSAGNAL